MKYYSYVPDAEGIRQYYVNMARNKARRTSTDQKPEVKLVTPTAQAVEQAKLQISDQKATKSIKRRRRRKQPYSTKRVTDNLTAKTRKKHG